jgi:hypothetical protein
MPVCKWCGKKGIFLSITDQGLCNQCDAMIRMDLTECLRLIQDSIRIIDSTDNADTAASRYDFIIEKVKEMHAYELKGIRTTDPLPSAVLADKQRARDRYIAKALERELMDKVRLKIFKQYKRDNRVKILLKFREKFNNYKNQMTDESIIAQLEQKIDDGYNALIEGKTPLFYDENSPGLSGMEIIKGEPGEYIIRKKTK